VAVLAVVIVGFLWVDLRFFARGREPTMREGTLWSLGWLLVGLAAALPILAVSGGDDAFLYTTVYLVERSLSLDNLFVFLVIFAYFSVPHPLRAGLIFWGIVLAIAMRGVAILAGVALLENFGFLTYVLAAALLLLAYRLFRADDAPVDPERIAATRLVRRLFPVTSEYHDRHWFVRIAGRRHATPLLLALAAVVFADIAFAIDSIPAAFGVTRDPLLIWTGNAFALLGLRALFVLVEGLIRRFRYLDETIAIVLGTVAVKLLIEDFYKVPAPVTFASVVVLMTGGILASIAAERREQRAREAA
jgi:tellurite resistance protein TerC